MRFVHLFPQTSPESARAARAALALLSAWALSACSFLPASKGAQLAGSAWAQATQLPAASGDPAPGWREQRVGNRTPTLYTPTQHAGRPALQADSTGGDSLVRMRLQATEPPAGRLLFSWFTHGLNHDADLADAAVDDAVVRVILQFGGDRGRFTPRDHRMSELVRLVTGEPLPYATLIYVWDPVRPVGTVIRHQRSGRIRKLVVQTGTEGLGRWNELERDVAADYRHAFGESPGPLESVGLMTDANNTGRRSQAWYGPLRWVPAAR